ncbi:ATP-binding cassette domain-containing protein [Reinekea marinisedimentorum]|uniref:ATP-binding cassette subfamily C protein CydC n=1 Tax=Reinekea marinisedimentorum TaxID=230495 RepID=A0A4R3I6J9_9GAMM|nr:ATP-binding cassette domain-containing protein [Reinekea marinisedimentorum]TCS40802.1 ATP-binding cassette subfamily C protein CydC [Reinekea marinisedimentorum]
MSQNVTLNRAISLILAICQLGSGIILLALSAWFIAACAVAGHAGVLAGFNYIIPAAVIRFLAIVRIFSSYFEKYAGHLSLLADLKDIRYRLLSSNFSASNYVDAEQTARVLQEDSERFSGRWSGIHNPFISAAAGIAGVSLVFVMLIPAVIGYWLVLLSVLAALAGLFAVVNLKAEHNLDEQYRVYYQAQHQWLSVSSLWHLREDWLNGEQVAKAADNVFKARQRQLLLISITETTMIALGFIWPLWLASSVMTMTEPSALWAIPLVLSVSVRDWFGPVLNSTEQRAKMQRSAEKIAEFSRPASFSLPKPVNEAALSVVLDNFRWQRGENTGQPASFQIHGSGSYLLTAPSGFGKSSLFDALSGELDYSGSAEVSGLPLQQLSQAERCAYLFYGEQFSHIFSDTLAQNLIMAADNTPDSEQLYNALIWAGLPGWANETTLRGWLGPEGKPVSGGEKKRIMLARAYLSDKPVWLLDEPFEGLDEKTAELLASRLNEMAKTKLLLIASHLTPKNLRITNTIRLND